MMHGSRPSWRPARAPSNTNVSPCEQGARAAFDVVRRVLPDRVLVAVSSPGAGDPRRLLERERVFVARAVESRRREFSAGRELARALLGQLGYPPDTEILRRPDRSPRWPSGIIGTISHTSNTVAVGVGRVGRFEGVGIDVEPMEPLPNGLESAIGSEREWDRLRGLPGWVGRALFSAKEAYFKAQYPLSGEFLDMRDVLVEFDWPEKTDEPGLVRARLRRRDGRVLQFGRTVELRVACGSGLIACGCVIGSNSGRRREW